MYMSVGNKIDLSALGDVPENMVIDHFLPQLAIHKRADVFIAHAGFNSVHEAMYFGVPMLALPQVNDQHMVAKRAVALGLGIMEDMTALTPDSLRTKIGALLEDRDMKDKCMRMSEDMKAAAKQDTTVQHLEADAASWRAVRYTSAGAGQPSVHFVKHHRTNHPPRTSGRCCRVHTGLQIYQLALVST